MVPRRRNTHANSLRHCCWEIGDDAVGSDTAIRIGKRLSYPNWMLKIDFGLVIRATLFNRLSSIDCLLPNLLPVLHGTNLVTNRSANILKSVE
jgi:hypothetical protein